MNRIEIAIALAVILTAGSGYAQSTSYLDFRPFQVIFNPATNKVYATNYFPPKSSVEIFDGATLNHTTIAVEGGNVMLALDPLTSRIYVPASGASGSNLTVIEGITGSILAIIPMPEFIGRVVADSLANKVYAVLENQIATIDGQTNLPAFVPLGTPSGDAAINPRTHKLYVSSRDVSRVTVVDGATNVTTVVPLPVPPSLAPNHGIAVNPVTNKIFVLANQGRVLAAIDGATNAVTSVPLPAIAHRNLAINTVTDRIYIANPVPRELTIVDGTTYAITTVPLPSAPAEVAVNERTIRSM